MNTDNLMGRIPQLSQYTIFSEKLPNSFDGFSIAHISDSHSKPAKQTFELINSCNPDIICITGDMLHDDDLGNQRNDFFELLDKLISLAPVYMVTGNHDLWRQNSNSTFSYYKEIGANLLRNTSVTLKKNDDSICLYGVDDPFSKLPEVVSSRLDTCFSYLPEFDGFKILLFHRANLFNEIKDYGFDLILSGHMHGGQIRLPFLGGVCAPTSALLTHRMLFPKYSDGEFVHNNTHMIVNRGIGNSLKIPRFGNPPEVGLITLKKVSSN